MDDEQLISAAREGLRQAYAPYSGYRVGAALLVEDGTLVTAGNVENVSYGLTMCAERAAVARAVAEGKRTFEAIAVVTDGTAAISPCGACRQVLAEFAPDIRVIAEGNEQRHSWSLRELLPDRFEAPADWSGRKE